jgi:hypothetical protein
MTTVWVVAEHRFEWFDVKHVCGSKQTALQRWREIRDDLIKEAQDMVEHCEEEGLGYEKGWEKVVRMLQNLKPGELCECDCPDIKEWEVEP